MKPSGFSRIREILKPDGCDPIRRFNGTIGHVGNHATDIAHSCRVRCLINRDACELDPYAGFFTVLLVRVCRILPLELLKVRLKNVRHGEVLDDFKVSCDRSVVVALSAADVLRDEVFVHQFAVRNGPLCSHGLKHLSRACGFFHFDNL